MNLGSYGVLNFFKPLNENKDDKSHDANQQILDWESRKEFSLMLEPRSLLILQEDCYHNLLHGIDEKSSDVVSKDMINVDRCSAAELNNELTRGTRISLTIRHVPKTTKPILRLGR